MIAQTRVARMLGVLLAAELGLVAACGTVHAALVISSSGTRNVTCSSGVCTATSKKAVLNVDTLASMLSSGDAVVQSGALARDIEIDAALSWTGAHRLTLDGYRAIAFNAPVVVAGPGALTITVDDVLNGGDFRFFKKGHVEFWDLSSSLIINGKSYVLENKLRQLARDIRRSGAGKYALAKSISEKGHVYSESPIPAFSGVFEGLGNTISKLTIRGSDAQQVGLFGELVNLAVVRDVGLRSVDVHGGKEAVVGSLAGLAANSAILNTYATGQVSGDAGSYVGGLVGRDTVFLIRDTYADVSVSADGAVAAGGLVGSSEGDAGFAIDRSYAVGPVSGGDNADVGGLVGFNSAAISDSYAGGEVTGGNSASAGGLIGRNADSDGTTAPVVQSAYSTGAVFGGSGSTIGGLIGQDAADAQITDAYWDLEASGISDPHRGAGNITDDPGITGLTTAQFKSGLPSGFDPATWKEKTKLNAGYPYLIGNQPPK